MPEQAPTAAPEAASPPEAAAPPAPALPDLDPEGLATLLDRYAEDPEKRKALAARLRTNSLVSGIAGDIHRQQTERERQEQARKAVEEEHERLRKLAAEDPLAFSETWLSKDDIDSANRRTADLRAETRREYIQRIGGALRDLPEAQDLSAEEHTRLANALAGVAEDDVLPVFQKFFTDLVSDKRAAKKVEAEFGKRLAAERKTWEREQADQRLKARHSPTIQAPSSGNAQDGGEPADFYSPEWAAWYDQKRKRGELAKAAR